MFAPPCLPADELVSLLWSNEPFSFAKSRRREAAVFRFCDCALNCDAEVTVAAAPPHGVSRTSPTSASPRPTAFLVCICTSRYRESRPRRGCPPEHAHAPSAGLLERV